MIRLLPRTPRGTSLLAGAVWLAGCAALWWALPYRPRVSWPTEKPTVVYGFMAGTVVLTSMPWRDTIDEPYGPMLGPLVARDADTGTVREWLPDNERLTVVEIARDGRHVLIGRVIGGRARLFLHDATGGKTIAELPRGGLEEAQFAAFRLDGRRIVYTDVIGDRRRLRVWDVEAKEEVAALLDAGPPVAWSPDGRLLAYCKRTGDVWSVRLWDLAAGHTRALAAALPANYEPNDLAFSPKGQKVAARISFPSDVKPISLHPQVIGWDVADGREAYRVAVPSLRFPLEATSFISVEWSEPFETAIVHRWDYDTGTECARFTLTAEDHLNWSALSAKAGLCFALTRHENPVMEMINQRVLGRPPGEWGSFRPLLFDSGTGEARYRLPMAIDMHFDGWSRSRWSPDGTLLAIAGNEQVAVWDIPPRRSLSWFAVGAVLVALPPFLIARRRVRRLRQEVPA